MLIREYIKGTIEAQGYNVGDIIIKRKTREMSIIIQVEKEIVIKKKGRELLGIMKGIKERKRRMAQSGKEAPMVSSTELSESLKRLKGIE